LNRLALFLGPLLALAAHAGAHGTVDATKITCAEFVAESPEGRVRTTAFLDGYSKKGVAEDAIGEVDVQRELDVTVIDCKENPKATLWERFKSHLPGGKLKVKPVKMTCEEFMALGKDVQPEVVYWLDGYNRKTKTDVSMAGQVDLERDTMVLVELCKPAPKESLWSRIKAKL
jgi:hypothetical protein